MMSLGAERRMETRLKKLEDMIRDPRSAINLESLLVSQTPHTILMVPSITWSPSHVCSHLLFIFFTMFVFDRNMFLHTGLIKG